MDLLDNGKPSFSVLHLLMNSRLISCIGALSVEHLKRIVIDASHIDQKKRGVMDMKDTMMPLAKWLTREEFKERYSNPDKSLDLLFF